MDGSRRWVRGPGRSGQASGQNLRRKSILQLPFEPSASALVRPPSLGHLRGSLQDGSAVHGGEEASGGEDEGDGRADQQLDAGADRHGEGLAGLRSFAA